jgi:threonyl-tRNA synthetase
MIHRVVFGSIERFIGILIEHFAGKFPVWLSPEQVKVLPVTDRAAEYAERLVSEMAAIGIRASADLRKEKIGRKILDAELEKVPYKLIVGDKEVENGTVSVRRRGEGDIGAMAKEDFFALVKEENDTKKMF